MLSEKSCRILTDVNNFYSVYIFLIRKLKGILLACLAVCPAVHLQVTHFPGGHCNFLTRELPKLLLVKALCETNAGTADHNILAFWLLCAVLVPLCICVSLGDGEKYAQAVTCEHSINAHGQIMAAFSMLCLHPPCQQPG